jgi:hypothetical protein
MTLRFSAMLAPARDQGEMRDHQAGKLHEKIAQHE